jgi:hypothetical protein
VAAASWHKGRLDDPNATIEIDESMMAGSAVAILIEENPSAPEAAALAPDLSAVSTCGDSAVRQTCARALGRLPKLAPRELAALRKRVGSDRRPTYGRCQPPSWPPPPRTIRPP